MLWKLEKSTHTTPLLGIFPFIGLTFYSTLASDIDSEVNPLLKCCGWFCWLLPKGDIIETDSQASGKLAQTTPMVLWRCRVPTAIFDDQALSVDTNFYSAHFKGELSEFSISSAASQNKKKTRSGLLTLISFFLPSDVLCSHLGATFGANELNFCVRYGYRCVLIAIITRQILRLRQSLKTG